MSEEKVKSEDVKGEEGAVVSSDTKVDVVREDIDIRLPDDFFSEFGNNVVVGDVGMKIARAPIEKYKGSTQKIDRCSFVSQQVVGIKTHYFEGVGSILCFNGKCCEMGGLPAVRYLYGMILYSTDNDGNIVSNKLDLRVLSAGDDLNKNLTTVQKGNVGVGGIDKIDCLITCTDDKYQKLSFSPAGPATWRKSKKAVQSISERWMNDGKYAYMAVARKVEPDSFNTLMGLEGESSSAPNAFSEENTDLGKFFDD